MKHLLNQLIFGFAAVVFLFEEWLWEALKRWTAVLGLVPGVRWLERGVARLPPAAAAVVFALPTLIALPVKIGALHLIGQGHALLGVALILAAKFGATALFARVYMLTRPALMQVRWFVRLHDALARWSAWAHRQLEAMPAWREARDRVRAWRMALRRPAAKGPGWLRRLRAAARLQRMRRDRP